MSRCREMPCIQNAVVENYTHVARSVANRAFRKHRKVARRMRREALESAALEGVWRGLASYDMECGVPLGLWLYRAARQTCARAMRAEVRIDRRWERVAKAEQEAEDNGESEAAPKRRTNPQDTAYRAWRAEVRDEEYQEELKERLSVLSEEERWAAEMRVEGKSAAEIAEKMGLTKRAVDRLFISARKKLEG